MLAPRLLVPAMLIRGCFFSYLRFSFRPSHSSRRSRAKGGSEIDVPSPEEKPVKGYADEWTEHDYYGRKYYYNKNTKESTWTKPAALGIPGECSNIGMRWNRRSRRCEFRQTAEGCPFGFLWNGRRCFPMCSRYYDWNGLSCQPTQCFENQFVSSINECTNCAPGSTRPAGDYLTEGQTSCTPTRCLENQFVSSNECRSCAPGSTNPAGDYATGDDTTCTPTRCWENQFVSSNECTNCAPGSTNPAGDYATGGDTTCSLRKVCKPSIGLTGIGCVWKRLRASLRGSSDIDPPTTSETTTRTPC